MSVTLQWLTREPPLTPVGFLARADSARRIALALVHDPRLSDLRAAFHSKVLLVFGADLPWNPDVTWLGQDGGLYVPTTLQSNVAPRLIAEHARQRAAITGGYVVATPDALFALPALPGPPDAGQLEWFANEPTLAGGA